MLCVTTIETSRLRLRAFGNHDLAALVDMASRWEVAGWFTHLPHPFTVDHGRQWIAIVQKDHGSGRPLRFAISLKETDQPIGACGLDANSGVPIKGLELGYWIGPSFWGHGFGREAVAALIEYGFRVHGAPAIKAVTHPENVASQKLLLSCGLKRNGEVELQTPMRRGGTRAPLFLGLRPNLWSRL